MKKVWLMIELVSLFFIIPYCFFSGIIKFPMIPALIAVFLVCLAIHFLASGKKNSFHWKISPIPRDIFIILAIFAISSIILTGYVLIFAPEKFLIFPKTKPFFWLIVMLLYPLLSVFPQEFIYRTFFFERYSSIFTGQNTIILASSITFSFLHIVFGNWVAVLLTFIGGILFSVNYMRNKSLFWVCFEHYLYGAIIFTVGLGRYFYGASFKG
ncbi:MAG TPA: CPBP family intramembrane metalloprotease [Victivallales bacterium]|nr:CPBP family intramembrane metalloprotease [Victivallales bacterium]